MAELPRYQRPGVLLQEMPNFDRANTREALRGAGILNDNLNQLSQWALGRSEVEAKERGEQYGAENPVSMEQLKDGTASLAPKGSVYGETARKLQIDGLVTDLSIESDRRLNDLKGRVENGSTDIVGAVAEMKDIQDGYSTALGKLEPVAERKLRAHVATTQNSALQVMQTAALKRERENRKVSIDQWVDVDARNLMRDHIEAGDTVDPNTGQKITPTMRIKTLEMTLRGALAGVGDDAFAREASKRFMEAAKEERLNALVKVAGDPDFARTPDGKFDPIGAVNRVDKGDFGRHTSVYKDMAVEEQAKVRLALRGAAADRYTADQHGIAEQKRTDTLQVNKLVTEYPTAKPGRRREIEGQLTQLSVRSDAISGQGINALKKSLKEGDGTGKANEAGETRMRLDILAGRIKTPEQVWETGLRYGVTPKQVNEVLGFYVARENREEGQADKRLRAAAGLVPGQTNVAPKRADAYISMTREAEVQYQGALATHNQDPKKNPAPDRAVIAEEIVKRRQESPHAKAVENGLKSLNDTYGTNAPKYKTGITFDENTNKDEARAAMERAKVPKPIIDSAIRQLEDVEQRQRQLNSLRN
jgi:hypothetical protein